MEKDSNKSFYNRLNVLAGTKSANKINENNTLGTLVDSVRANDGSAFGIVKEQHHYYIKKTNTQGEKLHESDFVYIGGRENKLEYEYSSLHEAQKQRNFLLKSLNETFSTKPKQPTTVGTLNEDSNVQVNKNINPFDLIKSQIKNGKKNISENREVKFKESLNTHEVVARNSIGLLPETANIAIKKALGILTEDVLTTADSEVKDGEILANKSGKETPQAPINDGNAKTEADKANATDSMPTAPADGKLNSLSVNEDVLTTADSEVKDGDVLPDKKDKKEVPQAPINDGNAKAEADKANATDSMPGKPSQPNSLSVNEDVLTTADSEINADASLTNQVNAGKETPQAPINDSNAKAEADKNDTGEGSMDEPQKVSGAIVVEGQDISTQDSDIKSGDMIANEKGHEKPEAPYNSYNQPNKAHTDGMKKGEDLKPKESKKDVVAEGENLTTADSEINTSDAMANKKDKKETPQAPINDTNAKAEADKNDTGEGSMDEPKKVSGAIVNEGIDDGESELDAAADALNDLTSSPEPVPEPAPAAPEETPAEPAPAEPAPAEPAPAEPAPAEPAPAEPAPAEPAPAAPEETPAVDDIELPADDVEGGIEGDVEGDTVDGEVTDDLVDSEIEKLTGKLTDKLRKNDNTESQIKTVLNSVISSVANDLADIDVEERKEISDKIVKAQGASDGVVDGGEVTPEEPAAVEPEGGPQHATGLEPDAENAINQEIASLDDGGVDEPIKEDDIDLTDAASDVGGDAVNDACVECGTFDAYMESRGYTNENMDDCSAMEMGNLISGYASAHSEGQNDGDFQTVAKYVTPEIESELLDYGQTEYLDQLKPHMGNVENDQKLSFGSIEPSVNPLDDLGETDEDPADGEGEVPAVEPEGDGIETVELDPNRPAPDVDFVGGADIMGVGVNKPDGAKTKSVDVDLQTGRVNVTMTEGEEKVRNYIRARLEEKAGKRKPLLSEDKKSGNLKKLDEMIDAQYNEFVKLTNSSK